MSNIIQLFAKRGNGNIIDVWKGSECASDYNTVTFQNLFFLRITIKRKKRVMNSHSFFNKNLHLHKYPFWLIPSKNPGNTT